MTSNPNDRRVAITGVALVSPLGNTKEALWDALVSGRSGVTNIDELNTNLPLCAYGGRAGDFHGNINDFGELEKDQKKAIRKALKLMCRETMMGVAVAQSALQDSGLKVGNYEPERAGCVFGTDYMLTMPEDFVAGVKYCRNDRGQFDYQRWGEEGLEQVTPLWLLKYLPNMPASHVAIYNDLRGPNNSLTLREAAANDAVGEAWFTIVRGSADLMIAGATGTRIHPMNAIHAYQQEETAAVDAEPTKASRPFDRNRSGMVLGEGAGAVVLEEMSIAKERGATIYGEVVARASSSVASANGVSQRHKALENVLRSCLNSSGLLPEQIGHIHAHGDSTRKGDADEAAAIRSVFDGGETCPVLAAKSYFGNLGAGSGMVELISSLLSLSHERLFQVLNYEDPDSDCPIRVATGEESSSQANFVNLSVTPQGQASAVLVRAVR